MLLPDRAGYGGSSHDPARTIASGARDVGQLMKELGLDGCSVIGLSGGGPTALACGVVSNDRVMSVATVGGVAPLQPRNPLLPADRALTKVARRSEPAARVLFAAAVLTGRLRPEKMLDRFASLLAETDARLLRDNRSVRSAFLDDLRHPSRTTAKAAAKDFSLFARPWDVDLADTAVPVQVWHGTEDRNVPVAHARVLAALCPTAQLHVIEGEGHMMLERLEEIVGSLRPGS